jgi:hypothetical protein
MTAHQKHFSTAQPPVDDETRQRTTTARAEAVEIFASAVFSLLLAGTKRPTSSTQQTIADRAPSLPADVSADSLALFTKESDMALGGGVHRRERERQ